jgi:hypothetical protein
MQSRPTLVSYLSANLILGDASNARVFCRQFGRC